MLGVTTATGPASWSRTNTRARGNALASFQQGRATIQ